ncbi:hypothetical protein TSUD_190270 [Trifolium subterraneum]|uniref:Serine-threonine/tyrosine-protein kinase catalytic domain-containing protein n=1 Tax=Trifolium subterraneum TaxID=3900 RepID=A0A2Z6PM57_TRISU|nr:hypothetical protein TSUD_190270 [Trifolium subterraneum]
MNNRDEDYYGIRELMDPLVRNTVNLTGFERFLELTMQCVEESASARPTMSEVVKALETILQNDGMNTNSTSASSSANDFGVSKGGAAMRHPYIDNTFTKKNEVIESNEFDYSGGRGEVDTVEEKLEAAEEASCSSCVLLSSDRRRIGDGILLIDARVLPPPIGERRTKLLPFGSSLFSLVESATCGRRKPWERKRVCDIMQKEGTIVCSDSNCFLMYKTLGISRRDEGRALYLGI